MTATRSIRRLGGLLDVEGPFEDGQAPVFEVGAGVFIAAPVVLDDDPRLDDAREPAAHTHLIADVTGLQDALDAKATTASLTAHTADTTGVHGIADTSLLVLDDDSRLDDARTPLVHSHAIADVTGLQAGLDAQDAALAAHAAAVEDVHGITDTGELVYNDDPRLTDARAPTAHTHAIADTTGLQGALDGRELVANRNVAGGYAGLDGSGKVLSSVLPALAITSVQSAASQAAMLALTTEEGDVVIRTDTSRSYIRGAGTSGTMADWTEILTPAAPVLSVNGFVGAVTLAAGDVGASPVGHGHAIADVTGLQAALDGKAAVSHGHAIADVTGLQAALDDRVVLAPAASARNVVQSTTNGAVPFTVKRRASGDMANLTEWQNDTGAVKTYVSGVGDGIGTSFLVDAAQTGGYWQMNPAGLLSGGPMAVARAAGNVPLAARGATSQTANLAEFQNSAGGVLAKVDASGIVSSTASLRSPFVEDFAATGAYIQANPNGTNTGGIMVVNRNGVGSIPLTVYGMASQSGNLTEWRDSTGAAKAAMQPSGTLTLDTAGGGVYAPFVQSPTAVGPYLDVGKGLANTTRAVNRTNAANTPFRVVGMAGQSGDLQRWDNSGSTTLYAIDAAGIPRWTATANQQTTVGAAGGASALPATPTKYLKVKDSAGTTLVVPAYAAT